MAACDIASGDRRPLAPAPGSTFGAIRCDGRTFPPLTPRVTRAFRARWTCGKVLKAVCRLPPVVVWLQRG